MLVLCSDNESLLAHWRQCLDGGYDDICEFNSLAELTKALDTYSVGLVLFDRSMLDLSQAEGLISRFPAIFFFILSQAPSPDEGIALARSGTRGYGNAWMHPAVLLQAVALVEAGELWLGREVILRLIQGVADSGAASETASDAGAGALSGLTPRELEIAKLVGNGETNKEIAIKLGITERTVKAHLSAIFKKTHTKDRLQLALLVTGQQGEQVPLRGVL